MSNGEAKITPEEIAAQPRTPVRTPRVRRIPKKGPPRNDGNQGFQIKAKARGHHPT